MSDIDPVVLRDEPVDYPAQTTEESLTKNLKNNRLTKKTAHPVACLCHFLFKLLPILSYLLFKGTTSLVLLLISLAVDFWATKNVTGRILVGLRWWTEQLGAGKTRWFFDTVPNRKKLHKFDGQIFWWSLIIATAFWALQLITNILSPLTLATVVPALLVTGTNLMSYIRCARDARTRIRKMATNAATKAVVSGAVQQAMV